MYNKEEFLLPRDPVVNIAKYPISEILWFYHKHGPVTVFLCGTVACFLTCRGKRGRGILK